MPIRWSVPGGVGGAVAGAGFIFSGAGYRYTEFRPLSFDEASWPADSGFRACSRFLYHEIDLGAGQGRFGTGCTGTACGGRFGGRSGRGSFTAKARRTQLINDYYWLHQLTRRRQGVPPQPFAWFRNLAECLPEAVRFRVAYHGSRPVAGIVTLAFRERLVYKYGASDQRYQEPGGTPLLFWRAIEEACERGRGSSTWGAATSTTAGWPPSRSAWEGFPGNWSTSVTAVRRRRWARGSWKTGVAEAHLGSSAVFVATGREPAVSALRVGGSWFLVPGSWFLVPGSWFLVSGFWFLVPGFEVRGVGTGVPPVTMARSWLVQRAVSRFRGSEVSGFGFRGFGGGAVWCRTQSRG